MSHPPPPRRPRGHRRERLPAGCAPPSDTGAVAGSASHQPDVSAAFAVVDPTGPDKVLDGRLPATTHRAAQRPTGHAAAPRRGADERGHASPSSTPVGASGADTIGMSASQRPRPAVDSPLASSVTQASVDTGQGATARHVKHVATACASDGGRVGWRPGPPDCPPQLRCSRSAICATELDLRPAHRGNDRCGDGHDDYGDEGCPRAKVECDVLRPRPAGPDVSIVLTRVPMA